MNILRKIKNNIETGGIWSFFFDLAARSHFYQEIIRRKIAKFSKKIKENKNYNIIIETSSVCNAECVMCPHKSMRRRKEIMNDDTFHLVIKKIKDEGINPSVFLLSGFGDPLVDQKIFSRIKTVKNEFPGSATKIYTNLELADEKVIGKILDCGLDEINVSFNGCDKKSYEKVMGINFEKTLNNLENLIRKRNKTGGKLKIRLSMAMTRHNDNDEKDFIKKWTPLADSVSVNKIHSYNGSVEDFSGKNKINFEKHPYPCKYIWNSIVIGAGGDIFLCCLDYEGKHNFGNIRETNISDAFYSDEFERIRKIHLDGDIKKSMPMCAKCYTPYKNGAEWLVDKLY